VGDLRIRGADGEHDESVQWLHSDVSTSPRGVGHKPTLKPLLTLSPLFDPRRRRVIERLKPPFVPMALPGCGKGPGSRAALLGRDRSHAQPLPISAAGAGWGEHGEDQPLEAGHASRHPLAIETKRLADPVGKAVILRLCRR
jgi:hypothetical protein